RGRLGCIVPSGIATDDTTKAFFQDIMTARSLLSLYDFENRERLFPDVDSRTKFCLLTLTGSAEPVSQGATFAFFLRKVEELQEPERCFTLSAEDVALINPNTRTCPVFRSRRDLQLTKAIYERVPVLVREGPPEENLWGVKFTTMFHMTRHSHLFRTREELERDGWRLEGNIFRKGEETYLPLYEGQMIWLFDHRFASCIASGPSAVDEDEWLELDEEKHANPFYRSIPHYWVKDNQFEKFKNKLDFMLVYRIITNTTNMRTSVFCFIPSFPCGNSLAVAIVDLKQIKNIILVQTALSSLVFDYVARQKVGSTNLNFFILKQLPVLPPARYQQPCPWESDRTLGDWIRPRALELTYTAWDLAAFARDCGYDGPPFRWDEKRRFLLRCELDAAYFHLYGIARDDVDYIMETFPIVRSGDLKRYNDYRTKRVILEIYDELQRASETGQPYRTRLTPPPADPAVAHPPRSS
ncbi:MAG: SAM-dependent DNA methyltransferase, partial [Thermogemmatispora sp.]